MLDTRCLRWLLVAALFLLIPATCPAQVRFRIKKDQPPLPIDASTAETVIDEVLKRLDEEYVFPDVATKMAQAVKKRQTDKEYAAIKTGQELAQRLTKDLQTVSKDKHLRIICSTDKLPKPPRGRGAGSGPTIPPGMKERMRRHGAWLNGGYQKIERLAGNVGYLEIAGFPFAETAAEPAAAAMNFLTNTNALIIDLRDNGGGEPQSVALLCSYFFDGKPVHLNSFYWRKGNRTEDFWTLKEVAGKRYLGKDVYLLTGPSTASGAEEFAYDLQTQKRAIVVGENTAGAAHPGGMSPLDDHFAMFVPTGRAINPITKTDWEGSGIKPDVAVPADQALERAHELAIKKLLETTKDDDTRRLLQMDLEHSGEHKMPKTARHDH